MQPTLNDLEQLARQAGDILRLGYEGEHEIKYKGAIDLVTEIDHRSEEYLLGEIQPRYTGHSIFSEEAGEIAGQAEHVWYIDPLDGTVNYAHGVPMFSVSIAYAHRGVLTLGVVYDPMRDELFKAELGKGAWLKDRRLRVSDVQELQRSLLVTGFPYDILNRKNDNFDNFVRLSRRSQGVRRLGSAAIDLCYVAAGRLDGYWELSLRAWDAAAGALIAAEAGATVTNFDGQPDFMAAPISILAAAPGIHAALCAALHEQG